MIEEICCKWWNDKLQLGVTEERKVYILQNESPVELTKEFHMNRPHFRIPKTSKRYSDLAINKGLTVQNKVIQYYCPF